MKPLELLPGQGVTARADLLRLLATAPRPELWLDDAGEHKFGYRHTGYITSEFHISSKSKAEFLAKKPVQQTGNIKLPLQMPFVHVIAERQTREVLKQSEETGQTESVYDPINEDDPDAKAPEPKRLVAYEELVPKARLMPALKRYLTSNRTAGLNVPLLVKQIAGQQLPRQLPRRRLKTWYSHWVVVLDFAKRLWPYRQDMHQLAEDLLHACGQSGVSIRIVNHGPLQYWTDWAEEQRPSGALPAKHEWRMPPAGTPVLLVSDLGLLEGPDSSSHRAWLWFIRELGKAQARPLALVPLGAEQLDRDLPGHLTLLRWSPDARIRPERALGQGQALPDGINDLLAMTAVGRRIDPPLLRAMRRLNPKAPLNAGLEGAFWCHADVEAGAAANIRREAQANHLAHFTQQLHAYHLRLEQTRYRHHAHLRAVLNHEETLLWMAHAKLNGAVVTAETNERITKADAFMRRLAATLKQPDSLQKGGVWWQVAQDIVQRADAAMGEHYKDLLTPLIAAIAEVRGDYEQVPDWIDPAELRRRMRGEKIKCWLVRDPLNGDIALQRMPATQNQSALGGPLTIDSGGIRIESADKHRWFPAPQVATALCRLNEETTLKLTTGTETLTLATVERPRGAAAWGCGLRGLWVRSPSLCGVDQHWTMDELTTIVPGSSGNERKLLTRLSSKKVQAIETRSPGNAIEPLTVWSILSNSKKSWESNVSFFLDEFGVLAEVDISTQYAEAIQSFRWIEPGTFFMGSPDDEPERSDNEGPQHGVTFAHGFWLADTACTQRLWQAVMGNNPSDFQDDPLQPVERVSWHDVQKFLRELKKLLPGCQADLPSEAEWEYACRAGTQTPFCFGPNVNPKQVNYHGDYPYAGGEQGAYRGETVAAKSLPANAWGLYEMHGNVWEWCRDGQRTYDAQAQVDPLGPQTGDDLPRCVRGGSWGSHAGWSRSAYRGAYQPGHADYYLGFRFCLRSIESGQEPESAAESPGRESGASPDAGRQGAEASESGLIDKLGAVFSAGRKPKRHS